MNYKASRVTRVTLNQDQIIAEGGTCSVFCIVIANSHTQGIEADIQDVAGNNQITITVPCVDTRILDCEFVADGGIVISGLPSNGDKVFVTVFHSQPS